MVMLLLLLLMMMAMIIINFEATPTYLAMSYEKLSLGG